MGPGQSNKYKTFIKSQIGGKEAENVHDAECDAVILGKYIPKVKMVPGEFT